MINGLKTILKDGRKPQTLRSDKGSEFANRWAKQFMKSENIYYYNTQRQTKADYAERVTVHWKLCCRGMLLISKLKNMRMLYKIWFQIITIALIHPFLVRLPPVLLNKSYCSTMLWKKMHVDSLKFQPIIKKVRKSVFKPRTNKFKVDDYVRLSHIKHPFEWDYQEKMTKEVFIIREILVEKYFSLQSQRLEWGGGERYLVRTWIAKNQQK